MTCPFAVGDRVRDTLSPSWPEATVTAVYADGSFDWRFDRVHVSHARLGISFQEGHTTPLGVESWVKV